MQARARTLLLRLLQQRALLCGLCGALGEALRERLERRAQRRERFGAEGQARRVEQAALALQAAVDLRDPAGGLELDGGETPLTDDCITHGFALYLRHRSGVRFQIKVCFARAIFTIAQIRRSNRYGRFPGSL
jgi:hypothetical protein